MRCAAAEALAELPEPGTVSEVKRLIDRYGDFSSPAYLPECMLNLLTVWRHVDAGTEERFVAAAKSPAGGVRLAAIRGWLRPGTAALPEEAADLRTDQDHRVRAVTIGAVARRHHPMALEVARTSVTDYRAEVRLAAIAAPSVSDVRASPIRAKTREHNPNGASSGRQGSNGRPFGFVLDCQGLGAR